MQNVECRTQKAELSAICILCSAIFICDLHFRERPPPYIGGYNDVLHSSR